MPRLHLELKLFRSMIAKLLVTLYLSAEYRRNRVIS